MKRKVRNYSGLMSGEVTQREIDHRKLARKVAAESIVLMKNDGALPIAAGRTVALYGNGAAHIIKGGTGSGDVNEREVVSVLTGLLNAGFSVVNADAVASAEKAYDDARIEYRDRILAILDSLDAGSDMNIFQTYASNPFVPPAGVPIDGSAKEADAALYIVSRVAGEGMDRFAAPGDYYLTDAEKEELKALAALNENVIVLINTGGQIDLKDILPYAKAILFISQGGMEIGNAVADILSGAVCPSGRLTDTWAVNYEDFPSSANFSHNNGDVSKELYEDGIYVGYRYFDSFGVTPEYPFGYGLSYTSFTMKTAGLTVNESGAELKVVVTNTGAVSGREVVQVYAALPATGLKKELKRLVGFAKTGVIAPCETETVTVVIAGKDLASFNESAAAWVLEAGEYALLTGKNAAEVSVAAVLKVEEDIVGETLPHVLPLPMVLTEIVRPDEKAEAFAAALKKEAEEKGIAATVFAPVIDEVPLAQNDADYQARLKEARALAEQLTDEEITAMLMGEITKGQDNIHDNELVTTGIYVPGAAGETSGCLEEKYGVPGLSMADGPAGLRILRKYDVDRATGLIYGRGLMAALEGGLFATELTHENADTYYMYATAIPVGTALAQTWDVKLLEETGAMVGREMALFGINWWLAPGMNIHRNPLCGRNFEYYSEDPMIAGEAAAAITRGVQSVFGCGTTIKHYAANNQEDNRMGVDSIISERALREIYLRGFERAIRTSQPMCIMTSYNLVNGVHSANSYDLCTELARNEWGFEGIIMTDWTTTTGGGSTPHGCAVAGNDLIMPGHPIDVEDIMKSLANGDLPREKAIDCVARLLQVIMGTY